MFKRYTAIVLAFLFVLGALPTAAFASDVIAEGTCGANAAWVLTEDGTLTIKGEGAMSDFEWGGSPWYEHRDRILSVILEPGLTYIGNDSFYKCASLESVSIPESVTSIGNRAFARCSNMTSISIPESVTSIGSYEFYACRSLKSVGIPSGITVIHEAVFYDCASLESISIPEGVTSIGDYAFAECDNLTQISIPNGTTSIGRCAFRSCSALAEITFLGDAPFFADEVFLGIIAIARYPADNDTWTSDVMQDYGGTVTWAAIGSDPGGGSGESPGGGSGENPGGGSGENPGGDSGESSGGGFGGGGSIVEFPNLTEDALSWTFEEGVLTISGEGPMANYGEVNKPWKDIREQVTTLVIEPGITSIGENAFHNMVNLSSVTIPDGVETIGTSAFSYCEKLTAVTLPRSLRGLDTYVFYATGLTEIHFPENLSHFGSGALGNCERLSAITVDSDNPTFLSIDGILFSKDQKTILYFPAGRAETRYVIPDGVERLGSSAFHSCKNLTEIVVPDSATIWEGDIFTFCTNLRSINIPDGVTSIGRSCFDGCTALTSISIPDSVKSIGLCAFYGCESLRDLAIPESVTEISIQAFQGCNSLEVLVIPDSVVFIGDHAFQECFNLTEVIISENIQEIEDGAFASCKKLSRIYFSGDAPLLAENVFLNVRADAFYPHDNSTWTEDVQKNYYGKMTWIPYNSANPFRDVPLDAFYEDPVLWAVEKGITSGTDATHFSPSQSCNRAQVVTFLWAAAGKPEPERTDNPFTDVPKGSYYERAVLWAVENGITSGTDATHFSPGASCTRAQVVTFLWAAAGKPAAAGAHPFTDVPDSAWYAQPVRWALENGITSGISPTQFGAGKACSRAQVITFLYGAYHK